MRHSLILVLVLIGLVYTFSNYILPNLFPKIETLNFAEVSIIIILLLIYYDTGDNNGEKKFPKN